MKLASLKDGRRDGRLIVVSRDLRRAVDAHLIAPTMLQALENWSSVESALRRLSDELNDGRARGAFDIDPTRLAAPLPRSFQWLDASAFHSHGDLMEKVFKLPPIEGKLTRPLMYQGASDDFLGARDDMPLPSEADGIDFEAELAIVTDRVPMGTPAERAMRHIKLVMLANDASLRVLAPIEMKTGFGWVQAKPATSFSPVAATPDELGAAWRDGRVHLPILVDWNGKRFGQPHAGAMGFGFHQLIAHAAYSRNLSAGTIIGSGTISNENYREVGSACIAERRGIEIVDHGQARTEYMKFGDTVRIDMLDASGQSIFGAIEQRIVRAAPPAST
ncbi:MAG: fumarylacetoacetate hydrolase family protein [Steroidobacteraceae bacterium]|nr:fumarylacetoacetate hydrolase family protein [Steroidobacteraceae bacterium]MDW8260001.1 fumarylacetoacetate hydrolase family protein [Gammaproteobacteria bacterium]